MSRAKLLLAALLALLPTTACQAPDLRAVVYYNFALLEESQPGEHYQQFADLNGGVVDFGCFVVQKRQVNCFDSAGTGEPNLRLGVVECACPCAELEPDPCDASRPPVRKGTIRGLVNQSEGPLVLGGVEMPTSIDLAHASDLFITIEANDDDSPQPSTNVLLQGELIDDGSVLRGSLNSPTTNPVQGTVTIVPVKDEVSL